MLRRMLLVLALVLGAFAVSHGTGQAAPLGATAQAPAAQPSSVEKAQYYYYRRYRPRRYVYRPFYRPRYVYRPYYRPYRFYRPRYYW